MLRSGTAAIFDGAKLGYWDFNAVPMPFGYRPPNDMNVPPIYVRDNALSAIKAYKGEKILIVIIYIITYNNKNFSRLSGRYLERPRRTRRTLQMFRIEDQRLLLPSS